jgi:hypothetical protein
LGSFFAEILEQGGHDLWVVRPSCAHQPSTDSDRSELETFIHQQERYLRINTGIESYPYSFVLTDAKGDIIADYPCIYQTEAERDRQINYLWRSYGTESNRLWIGQLTFCDQAAATRETERICFLATQPERYRITPGITIYSLSLTDETGQVIAEHPEMYKTQAEGHREIERLWRRFFSASCLQTKLK